MINSRHRNGTDQTNGKKVRQTGEFSTLAPHRPPDMRWGTVAETLYMISIASTSIKDKVRILWRLVSNTFDIYIQIYNMYTVLYTDKQFDIIDFSTCTLILNSFQE